jgi:hypothetical protein
MSAVMDIYSLIKDLMDEAEKNKNEQLVSKLIVIEKQVNELDKENQELKKTLDIQEKRIWDDNNMSFTLPENSKVHYCSVCYGHSGKLIPMWDLPNRGLVCRVCEEIWMKGNQR